jgi:hypothetical protein
MDAILRGPVDRIQERTVHLPRGSFCVRYRPLKTGRLQSVPHTYIGKELIHYFRPIDDPDLKHGYLFSLDFSQQELRLLAELSGDLLLVQLAQHNGDIFKQIMQRSNTSIQLHGCYKVAMYSFIYGSDGWALKEYLDKKHGFDPNHLAIARHFGDSLKSMFPGIGYYQSHLVDELCHYHQITAPGGVIRVAGSEEGELTRLGRVNIRWARKIALSHVVQGAGAWITRKVVTGSVNLKESYLLMPVHDGFVFYSQSDNPGRAIIEARKLLQTCANEVAPHIQMPIKCEWIKGASITESIAGPLCTGVLPETGSVQVP